MATADVTSLLVCRVGAELAGLALEHVEEIMRPLPVEPVAGAPEFVLGVAIVRGVPTPVVDAGRLLANESRPPTRFVTVRVRARQVALAVDAVVGVRRVPSKSLETLPPLLSSTDAGVVRAVTTLDAELFVVLESGRLLPESAEVALGSAATA